VSTSISPWQRVKALPLGQRVAVVVLLAALTAYVATRIVLAIVLLS